MINYGKVNDNVNNKDVCETLERIYCPEKECREYNK